MAYSCVRVNFEIGHEASIRNKRTADGFTHDWEVFVRGADNAEIQHFVDKVVFHLHETFPKPKRIVKEPPYTVKESGYAGFNLPIDIYLKTKEEGSRKIRFYYDLSLQPIGIGSARISNVVKEKWDFTNPVEDFRRKLIRGGGVGVGVDGTTSSSDKASVNSSINNVSTSANSSSNNLDEIKHSPHSASKGKGAGGLGDVISKKYKAPKEIKPEESRLTNSFAELFGTPIKTIKHSPNPKPPQKPVTDGKSHEKSNQSKESSSNKVPKHSPAKDKDRERREKDFDRCTKDRERTGKDKDAGHKGDGGGEKSKGKSNRKSGSSLVLPQKEFVKKEEDRGGKKIPEEISGKDKSSSKNDSTAKSEKEKKYDGERKGRSDDKKEKHKKEVYEKKETAKEVVEKEKAVDRRHEVKEPSKELAGGGGKHREDKKSKGVDKVKEKGGLDSEKPKHKHKKKDKHRKDEERDKAKKKEKDRDLVATGITMVMLSQEQSSKGGKSLPAPAPSIKEAKVSSPSSPTPTMVKAVNPLNTLLAELSDKDSDSDFSGAEDAGPKPETIDRDPSPPPLPLPPPPPPTKAKEEKKATDQTVKEELTRPEKVKKKEKRSKDEEHRKRKRKHKDRGDSSREEPHDKSIKLGESTPSTIISGTTGTIVKEEKMSPVQSSPIGDGRGGDRSGSHSPEETLFTEEYINQLKDLQRKIMTLQDNADLQKVVQVISETGQFEITQRTFDFDLCALDPSTVKMLQDMFISA